MQVVSGELVCCTTEDQSLVLSVMSSLLYNATNLVTLRLTSVTSYDPTSDLGYPYVANFTFTASSSNYSSVPTLETVSD